MWFYAIWDKEIPYGPLAATEIREWHRAEAWIPAEAFRRAWIRALSRPRIDGRYLAVEIDGRTWKLRPFRWRRETRMWCPPHHNIPILPPSPADWAGRL